MGLTEGSAGQHELREAWLIAVSPKPGQKEVKLTPENMGVDTGDLGCPRRTHSGPGQTVPRTVTVAGGLKAGWVWLTCVQAAGHAHGADPEPRAGRGGR